MFNNRFRKYFRYAQMASFIFETIIEFSDAIKTFMRQKRRTSYRFCVISGVQKWRHKFI